MLTPMNKHCIGRIKRMTWVITGLLLVGIAIALFFIGFYISSTITIPAPAGKNGLQGPPGPMGPPGKNGLSINQTYVCILGVKGYCLDFHAMPPNQTQNGIILHFYPSAKPPKSWWNHDNDTGPLVLPGQKNE